MHNGPSDYFYCKIQLTRMSQRLNKSFVSVSGNGHKSPFPKQLDQCSDTHTRASIVWSQFGQVQVLKLLGQVQAQILLGQVQVIKLISQVKALVLPGQVQVHILLGQIYVPLISSFAVTITTVARGLGLTTNVNTGRNVPFSFLTYINFLNVTGS